MLLKVKFDRGNGDEEVTISPRAQIGWELKTGGKISQLTQGIGIRDMVIMVMEQLKAQGETVPNTPEKFADDLVDINPIAPDDEEGPTEPAA